MIDLTPAQRQILESKHPCLRDPETGVTYVLVPAEVYQRMLALLDDTVTATGELVDRVMAADDANDPYLEEYQRLDAAS